MGDTLLSSYGFGDIRVYATRNRATGKIAVWVLNFSGSAKTTLELTFQNLPEIGRATLRRLEDTSGTTGLNSANPASDMPGGPAINVEWNSSALTDFAPDNIELIIPPATLSLLVLEPAPLQLTPAFLEEEGERRLSVTFERLRTAAGLRYLVFASDDLEHWELLAEVEPGTPENVTVADIRPIRENTRRFLRVELQRENTGP